MHTTTKNLTRLSLAAALSVVAFAAAAETATATVTHVEDRKVVDTTGYASVEDMMHDMSSYNRGTGGLRIGGTPMTTEHVVRAKKSTGGTVELTTAEAAPEVGAQVSYDTKTRVIAK